MSTFEENAPVTEAPEDIYADARRVLAEIDVVLSRQNHQSQALWDILTALRGPDAEDWGGKDGTVKIRSTVFPETVRKCGSNYSYANGALMRSTGYDEFPPSQSPHFDGHIDAAYVALKVLGLFDGKKVV